MRCERGRRKDEGETQCEIEHRKSKGKYEF